MEKVEVEKVEWVQFFFDGNLFSGIIHSPEKWRQLVETYRGQISVAEILDQALSYRHPTRTVPSFGFYAEFKDRPSLGEWAVENGMDLAAIANQA